MKIIKITCYIGDITKVIETLVCNNVYDFNITIHDASVTIRINNSISIEDYEQIKDSFRFDTRTRVMRAVYIYPEDGRKIEIYGI